MKKTKRINVWKDQSGNGNDLIGIGEAPILHYTMMPNYKQIGQACAWVYQICGNIFLGDWKPKNKEDVKVLDILSAIASGCEIPHKKLWKIK